MLVSVIVAFALQMAGPCIMLRQRWPKCHKNAEKESEREILQQHYKTSTQIHLHRSKLQDMGKGQSTKEAVTG